MAKKDDLWLVTHTLTAERLTPKKEKSNFAENVGVGIAVVAGLVWALWFFGS